MPSSYSLIATVGLVTAILTQVQEPAFDFQVAIPKAKQPNPSVVVPATQGNSSGCDPANFGDSSVRQLNLGEASVRPEGARNLTPGAPQYPSSPYVSSVTPNQLSVLLQGYATNSQSSPLFGVDRQGKIQRVQPMPLNLFVGPPRTRANDSQLQPSQPWTWDSKQMREFDRASTESRARLKSQPGFDRILGREFGYYASPLNGDRAQVYTLPNSLGGVPFYTIPGQKKTTPQILTIPGQKWATPKVFTLPGDMWTPKLFVAPGQFWTAPGARFNIQANTDGLLKTLTPHQKENQKKRGFLHFGELTPAQQKLLTHPKGQFEIEYHAGGSGVTIKN
jgi:hypothetical protein